MFNYFLSIDVANVYLIIITILFFFCLIMYVKYIELKFKIEQLKKENLYIKGCSNIVNNVDTKKDVVSIEDISIDDIDNFANENVKNSEKESSKVVVEMGSLNKKVYNSNNLNKRISSSCLEDNNGNFNLNDFVKEEVMEREVKKSCTSYLDEVSFNLSNGKEIKAVELTDYEKNQEENAIISYQELLKVKNDDESVDLMSDDTSNFIEELKAFRNSLN